jgi:hypothetical protein
MGRFWAPWPPAASRWPCVARASRSRLARACNRRRKFTGTTSTAKWMRCFRICQPPTVSRRNLGRPKTRAPTGRKRARTAGVFASRRFAANSAGGKTEQAQRAKVAAPGRPTHKPAARVAEAGRVSGFHRGRNGTLSGLVFGATPAGLSLSLADEPKIIGRQPVACRAVCACCITFPRFAALTRGYAKAPAARAEKMRGQDALAT